MYSADATQYVPLYRYASTGERLDNITDWALNRFRECYGAKAGVSKDAIFAYVYAALHDPLWRETYAINLKREFPRIPFHDDFRRWADWGRRLLALHIGYEAVEPWPLERVDVEDAKARAAGLAPKPVLKAERAAGVILLDSETRLEAVPAEAWEYRLGNRSALDWVLDQHKEKTPKDPTIRAKFDSYRFADHKERVADLLARVTRVAVETVAIVAEMRALRAGEPRDGSRGPDG
jgi:predicted helicase